MENLEKKDILDLIGRLAQRQDRVETRADRAAVDAPCADGFFKTLFFALTPLFLMGLTSYLIYVHSVIDSHREEYLNHMIVAKHVENEVTRNTGRLDKLEDEAFDLIMKRTLDDKETISVFSRIIKLEERVDKNEKMYGRK